MKVYLSGNIKGVYRAQNIIKALSDSRVQFTYAPPGFLIPRLRASFLRFAAIIILAPILVLIRTWFVASATHVIVLPMNFSLNVLFDVIFARCLRKSIVVDFYISAYDTFVNDRKTIVKNGFSARVQRWKDQVLLRSASKIIFLNTAESIYYQSVAGVILRPDKTEIIPLCVDYRKESIDYKAKQTRTSSAFRVCWWGTYIPLHGLEAIIEAFAYLKHLDVDLHIFGDCDEKAQPYRELIQRHQLGESVFLDNTKSFANGELAPFLSQNCDLALGNFGDSQKAKTVLVNKVVDALSLGIPCLTMPTKAVNEMAGVKDYLFLCDGTAIDIANRISELLGIRDTLWEVGRKGFGAYIETFSPEVFQKRLLKMLTAI